METLQGALEHIVFHNETNGYTVADFNVNDTMVTVVGNIDSAREGLYLKLRGEWVRHPVYGEQFKLSHYTIDTPTTETGLIRYLGSGLLPGIGEKKAEDIVAHFGMKVLDILDHEPERLIEIPGIGKKTVAGIIEAYSAQKEIREVLIALQEYGISVNYGMKLYKVYGADTVSILLNDPYRMIRDVDGIGFKIADHIASLMEIQSDHPKRLEAGIVQSLRECYTGGNTYLNREDLIATAAQLLGVFPEVLEQRVDDLVFSGDLRMEMMETGPAYFPPMLYEAEDTLALNLVRLTRGTSEQKIQNGEESVNIFEKTAGIKLDDIQAEAIITALEAQSVIITGGPGTGKTTIISALIDIFEKNDLQVVLCAPTGRAAKRMSEATGKPAKTIHRLLEYEPTGEESVLRFGRDEENPLEEDVVIVDETSMVDTLLMSSLTEALRPEMRLILVGDVDQLPSVGPGQVLRDLIESDLLPVVRLKAVYRQAKGSAIAETAVSVNQGIVPSIPQKGDVLYGRKQSPESLMEAVLSLAEEFSDIQIITPMKKGLLGTISLNAALQKKLNPPAQGKNERELGKIVFREGDKVMQIKNDYRIPWIDILTHEAGKGVFNGDIGIITKIDTANQKITVRMTDEKIVDYTFEQLPSLTHAYALTVHKSQGSEFAKVIIPLIAGPPFFLTRKLLYTAMTRAKSQLFLIGPWQNLVRMVYSDSDASRRTGLKERIAFYDKMLGSGKSG